MPHRCRLTTVTPAKAGVQLCDNLDSGVRRNDHYMTLELPRTLQQCCYQPLLGYTGGLPNSKADIRPDL